MLTLAEIEQILNNKGGHAREGQPGETQSLSGSGGVVVADLDPIAEDVFALVSAELAGLKHQFGGFDAEVIFVHRESAGW